LHVLKVCRATCGVPRFRPVRWLSMLLVILVSSTQIAFCLSSRIPKPLWHILPRFKAMLRLFTVVLKRCVNFSPGAIECRSVHLNPALVVLVAS